MRRFSAEYLADTRRGMWDARDELAPLDLSGRERVVDVGCGTGAFSRVLAEETPGRVIGVDRDPDLLRAARSGTPPVEAVRGDACALPFGHDAADLVVCQALLVNLPEPLAAVREFRRVSSALVAVVEPDNDAVTVDSTVDAEECVTGRAREHYVAGVPTDVTLGAVPSLFRDAGLVDVETRRYDHERSVAPPYGEAAVEGARRKATAARLDEQRDTLRAGGLDDEAYAALRGDWRAMGRAVAEQMADGEYRRRETVPFYVTVGRVPPAE